MITSRKDDRCKPENETMKLKIPLQNLTAVLQAKKDQMIVSQHYHRVVVFSDLPTQVHSPADCQTLYVQSWKTLRNLQKRRIALIMGQKIPHRIKQGKYP